MGERRTPIERAVLDQGISVAAAVRSAAVDQVGRLVAALDAEVARIEKTEPLDIVAATRVARTWRQLAPLMELREQAPLPAAAPAPEPPSFAARIAAQHDTAPTPVLNGATPAAT